MTESLKKYRAHFPKGKQSSWLSKIRKTLSINEIAIICQCSERTVRDWQREKFHMDYQALERVCAHLSMPKPQVKKIPTFAHTQRAGKQGGQAVLEKYGRVPINEINRKNKWEEWWLSRGHLEAKITQPKSINKPKKSDDLAEFVGIIIGDGGISSYQLKVTLHSVDDKAYGVFVSDLILKLFDVPVSVRARENMQAIDYVVSRKKLVKFCVEQLGLKLGNKLDGTLHIPHWIMKNQQYSRACVRGLIDTDGSIFNHKYKVKGKSYNYKKLCFSSASVTLCKDVAKILQRSGIKPSCHGRNVSIESKSDMETYLKLFGSNNPKHLKRWSE